VLGPVKVQHGVRLSKRWRPSVVPLQILSRLRRSPPLGIGTGSIRWPCSSWCPGRAHVGARYGAPYTRAMCVWGWARPRKGAGSTAARWGPVAIHPGGINTIWGSGLEGPAPRTVQKGLASPSRRPPKKMEVGRDSRSCSARCPGRARVPSWWWLPNGGGDVARHDGSRSVSCPGRADITTEGGLLATSLHIREPLHRKDSTN
jgi:hypothetical protein